MSTVDGVTHPWRDVESTSIEAMVQHGYRRMRWSLLLTCGHEIARHVDGMRGPGWQKSRAPRKVRCAKCTEEIGQRVVDPERFTTPTTETRTDS